MAYFDFVVTPVKTERMDEYKKLVKKSAKIWKKYGAVSYRECIAEDVKPGKSTSFPQSLKLKADETVGVAYVEFKSRKHRDQAWAKVMKDPFMSNYDMKAAPFDAKRMFFGGFTSLV
jgi:uncharacterized protein YbaA (DUF1428 family)